MKVHISAAVLLIGVPVANTTLRPLFFSNTACAFRNTPCAFFEYEGSTPLTPRCIAVAKPRCLYSCASSTRIASIPISSKFSTSSVALSSISSALTSVFCFVTASLFSSRFLRLSWIAAAISAFWSSSWLNSLSACFTIILLPSASASLICSSTRSFSSILS